MNECNCFVFLFESTHHALSAEKALKDAGIRHAVINTPRELSASCCISLRIDPALKDEAVSILDERGVIYAEVIPYRSRWA